MADQRTARQPSEAARTVATTNGERRHRSAVAYHRVLVPVTASTVSERTVVIAAQLASEQKAEVTVLAVIEVPKDLPLEALFPDEEHEAKESLRRAAAILGQYGVRSKTRLMRSFSTATAIVEAAQDARSEIIVMSAVRHLRKRANDLGDQVSIFEQAENLREVLKAAPCRVLLVSPPPDEHPNGRPPPR
jgi:nucleotide-binding universal stress UspA family protein